MDTQTKKELQIFATKVRMGVIDGTYCAKAGHPGGSLSIAEVLTWLYTNEMNVDPKNPKNPGRDRLVLSKGHAAPALYSVMAQKGYFPVEELKTLRKVDSRLQGHPSMNYLPGIDISSGSLGQGLSAAAGIALGKKLDKENEKVYVMLGDGECEEGQVWEAAMFAVHQKIDNLVALVDWNRQQIDGCVDNVAGLGNLDDGVRGDFQLHRVLLDFAYDAVDAAVCLGTPSLPMEHAAEAEYIPLNHTPLLPKISLNLYRLNISS